MATKNKVKPRLKKGPDLQDFVVETIDEAPGHRRITYSYANYRKTVRAVAKNSEEQGYRTRTFKINYVLIRDSKKKVRK